MTEIIAAAPPTRNPPYLSRRRKAAMIVQLLIGDGGKLALTDLPEALQAILAHELGAIRLVDRQTVHAVASEFADELGAIGLSAPGGADAAISALSDHISPAIASQLRAELAVAKNGDPWTLIEALDPVEMRNLMLSQSTEICAIVLSKLPVSKAADVLAALPGDRARTVTFAVSQTENVAPEIVKTIGHALVADHCGAKVLAFDKKPDSRVGAILNSSPAQTREALLSDLDQQDANFAANVRKTIFTFKDIPLRIIATDIPTCIREVDPDVLSTAMAAALAGDSEDAAAAEFILSSISQRMAGQIREDADERGKISSKDADSALRDVSTAIRTLVDTGVIKVIADEEPDTSEQ